MPIGPARMPIMDHLGELRRRLVISVVAIILVACVVYIAAPTIIDFLKYPVKEFMPDDGELYVMTPLGGFMVKFKVAFFVAFIVAMPLLVWEFMAFLLPALRPNERKWFIPTFAVALALYLGGMAFCYCIILHPAFQWMYGETSSFATILADAERFIRMILLFEVGFGLAFELPLIVFYLVYLGVIPYVKLRRSWRYVYIALMVVSAMITPDANPVTMLLMFAAMVALYELALLISRIALSNKIKKQKEEGTYTGSDDEFDLEAAQARAKAKKAEKAAAKGKAKAQKDAQEKD